MLSSRCAQRVLNGPLAEAGRVMFQDFDAGFEGGLALLLAGVEATLLGR
ncbi:hypothetical protein ATKI12_4609 [Kitasatospora sp. Ki12]